jgi:hypothetical protein
MRSYPRNSPEAAARIVALALLADGHLSLIEIDALELHGVASRLGLSGPAFREVMHGLCEDLLVQSPMVWLDNSQIDPHLVSGLLSEIDHPSLCNELMHLCRTVIESDRHMADGEALMLSTAVGHWHHTLPPRRAMALAG